MNFYLLTFELRKYEKCQITFEFTDLKTEKKQNVGLLITSERKYFVLSDFSAVFSSRNLKVLFLKLVNMDTEEPPRMKLNKEDLVSITLDYQAKFNNILDDLKKDISDLKIIYLG